MNTDYLIKMVNEIAAFFESESTPEQAPREVATHLRKYWEPRMRREIVAHYQKGAAGLNRIASDGVALVAADLCGEPSVEGAAASR